jgi:hypothetical protein
LEGIVAEGDAPVLETAPRGRLYGFGDGFAEYVELRLKLFHAEHIGSFKDGATVLDEV